MISLKILEMNRFMGKLLKGEHFDAFLNDRINGYDVIAEIILSKILEEYLEADVFVTKLGLTTNTNMKTKNETKKI